MSAASRAILETAGYVDHLVALKGEQTARIVLRDTALYIFIGTIFGAYAAEGQAGSNSDLVQQIRAFSLALAALMFSIYLSNDYYVSRIGTFVGKHPAAGKFSEWEAFHRKGVLYHLQKLFRTLVIFLLFGGWTVYQGALIFATGEPNTRIATIVFGSVVALELVFFISLLFERRTR